MGARIYLQVATERISPAAWTRVYEESWRVLRFYPNVPMTLGCREVAGTRVNCYQRNVALEYLTGGRGWRVTGDMKSKLRGESFDFPEVFGKAQANEQTQDDDILVDKVRNLDGDYYLHNVFNSKHASAPYRVLILAVATLVENRFPRAALAGGDVGLRDCSAACALLERALGEHFELPILFDETRLQQRLVQALGTEAAETAIGQLGPPVMSPALGDIFGMVLNSPGARLDRELESCMACTNVATLTPKLRKVIVETVQSLAPLERYLELDQRIGTSASFDRVAALHLIASGTDANGLYLTEDAWNEIEAEPPELLRFLVVVSLARCSELRLHQLSRALLESSAIRRFASMHWKAAGPPDLAST